MFSSRDVSDHALEHSLLLLVGHISVRQDETLEGMELQPELPAATALFTCEDKLVRFSTR